MDEAAKRVSMSRKELEKIPDPRSTEEEFHTQLVKGVLEKLLRKLEAKEATVLRLYFGLAPNDQPMKMEEVAQAMGFSSLSYVNMLKNRALWKLRNDPHAEYLAELWGDFG